MLEEPAETHTDIYEYAVLSLSREDRRNVLLFFLINSQCHTALQPRHLLAAHTKTEALPLSLLCRLLCFVYT